MLGRLPGEKKKNCTVGRTIVLLRGGAVQGPGMPKNGRLYTGFPWREKGGARKEHQGVFYWPDCPPSLRPPDRPVISKGPKEVEGSQNLFSSPPGKEASDSSARNPPGPKERRGACKGPLGSLRRRKTLQILSYN